jgi:hypothetical protein
LLATIQLAGMPTLACACVQPSMTIENILQLSSVRKSWSGGTQGPP